MLTIWPTYFLRVFNYGPMIKKTSTSPSYTALRRSFFCLLTRMSFDFSLSSQNPLLERSRNFDRPEDIKYSIEYLRYLRRLPVDCFDIPRIDLTTSLIEALATQLEFVRDGTHIIDEMLVLFRELLTSSLSADIPEDNFEFLIVVASDPALYRGHFESLDAVIECLRDEVKICPPDSLVVLYPLACMLQVRFIARADHSNDDYEESMTLFERIIDSSQTGECPDAIRDSASSFSTMLVFARSTFFKNPEYCKVPILVACAIHTLPLCSATSATIPHLASSPPPHDHIYYTRPCLPPVLYLYRSDCVLWLVSHVFKSWFPCALNVSSPLSAVLEATHLTLA